MFKKKENTNEAEWGIVLRPRNIFENLKVFPFQDGTKDKSLKNGMDLQSKAL